MVTEENNIERIEELITGYLAGSISDEEEIVLLSLLRNNPKYRQLFTEARQTWQITAFAQHSDPGILESQWNKLKKRIQPSAPVTFIPVHSLSGNKRIIRMFLAGTAAAVVIFLSSLLVFLPQHNKGQSKDQSSHFTINVPNGTRSEITLTDGTRVWLNAGSILEYAPDYNLNSREVKLCGEAFFDVVSNKNKPFIVKTSGISITAYGTSFNVKAYPEERTITATLVEGKIKVEGTNRDKKKFAFVLAPNQNVVIEKDPLPVQPEETPGSEKNIASNQHKLIPPEYKSIRLNEQINTLPYISWKDKRWVIEKESLDDLIVSLERRYNIKIIFDARELRNFTFTGIIQNETFEQVLKILQLTAPIKFELSPGEAHIYADSERLTKFRTLMNESQNNQ